ncbi:unnamed protein product, partial [Lymnaea stagnalis]
VLIASIIGLVAVFTVVSNVIVLIALVRSRREDNRNILSCARDNGITKLTMASMTVVDVLIGMLLTPLFSVDVINKGRWYLGRDLCTARQSLNNVLCSVLIFNILVMALDKYLAICKPMYYRLLTVRHGYAMVVLSWSIPCVIFTVLDGSGLSHIGVEDALVTYDKMHHCAQALNKPVVFTMSITTIVLPYKSEGPCDRNIQVAQPVAYDNKKNVGRCPNTTVRSRPSHRNLRAYKTIGCIFFCFTLCWVPSWIFVIIFVYDGFTTTLWALILFLFLTYTNAAINPFIY